MLIVTIFLLFCFPGSVLEKAGGDEFKEEVKKLSESHGPLELTTGKCLLGKDVNYRLNLDIFYIQHWIER